jgi:fumarate hydratase class II
MATTRIQRHSFGTTEVPPTGCGGAQTRRSLDHFRISCKRMRNELVRALAAWPYSATPRVSESHRDVDWKRW